MGSLFSVKEEVPSENEYNLRKLRELTIKRKRELDLQFKREQEREKQYKTKYMINIIDKKIIRESQKGNWMVKLESYDYSYIEHVYNRLYKHYQSLNFKVTANMLKIVISWEYSEEYINNMKKFRKVVNAIIFIRRLRENYYKPGGKYHKDLNNKYKVSKESLVELDLDKIQTSVCIKKRKRADSE